MYSLPTDGVRSVGKFHSSPRAKRCVIAAYVAGSVFTWRHCDTSRCEWARVI